ncbi:MAG: hypothetical protein L3K26_07595 [Candidatus Hydrogenedentes bacterium]|nr:hypothetical protein [Candidatus Hydrogenedentota bacterium]
MYRIPTHRLLWSTMLLTLATLPAFAVEMTKVDTFPAADPSAFGVVATGLADNQLIVWNGNTVYRQSATDATAFEEIATGYAGDPAFIVMAPNGTDAYLGAGFSGSIYRLDTTNPADFSEAATVATLGHFSGAFLSDTLLLIDAGAFGQPSELTILDLSGQKAVAVPVVTKSAKYARPNKDTVVVKPDGSFSAALAVDGDRVYALDGNTTELRFFSVASLIQAYEGQATLDWATDGTLVEGDAPFLGGGVGGLGTQGELVNGGFGAIKVFNAPEETSNIANLSRVVQPAGSGVFYSVISNPFSTTDRFYARIGDFTPDSTINGDVYQVILDDDPAIVLAEGLLGGFEGADTDSNGSLSYDEAVAFDTDLTENQFALLDSNTDGVLTATELEGAGSEGEGEGEGEDESLETIAEDLLDGLDGADVNDDGTLSFAEAQALVAALTQTQFDALDTDSDGQLNRSELEAQAPTPAAGCALPDTTALQGFQDSLSKLIVFLMALLTLLGFNAAKSS